MLRVVPLTKNYWIKPGNHIKKESILPIKRKKHPLVPKDPNNNEPFFI